MADKGFGFRNLSVAWKLRCMAIVTCVLLLAMGAVAVYQLSQSQNRLQSMYSTNLQNTKALDNTSISYRDVRLALRALALAQTAADTDSATTRLQGAFNSL